MNTRGGCLIVISVALALLIALVTAAARDDGRYAQSPLKEWFEGLSSGYGNCCSVADGLRIDDPDWEVRDGHYRVRLQGGWIDVPDRAVVRATNRVGYAIVWPIHDGSQILIRCFMPGAET